MVKQTPWEDARVAPRSVRPRQGAYAARPRETALGAQRRATGSRAARRAGWRCRSPGRPGARGARLQPVETLHPEQVLPGLQLPEKPAWFGLTPMPLPDKCLWQEANTAAVLPCGARQWLVNGCGTWNRDGRQRDASDLAAVAHHRCPPAGCRSPAAGGRAGRRRRLPGPGFRDRTRAARDDASGHGRDRHGADRCRALQPCPGRPRI
jgi:hypothetical protein